jgi:hypothetical protein
VAVRFSVTHLFLGELYLDTPQTVVGHSYVAQESSSCVAQAASSSCVAQAASSFVVAQAASSFVVAQAASSFVVAQAASSFAVTV